MPHDNTPPRRPAPLLTAAAAALAAIPGAAHAQKAPTTKAAIAPAAASVVVPDVPQAPANPAFADELAGRRLLYAAREAYHNAPAVRFSATWRSALQQPNPRRPAVATGSGSETVVAEPGRMRLSLETEATTPGEGDAQPTTLLRRAVANGSSMVATRVARTSPKAAPTREFARLPFAEVGSLADALALMKLAPRTTAARMVFAPEWGLRGSTWRVPGLPATVVETEPVRQNERFRVTTTRRYKLDPNSRLLLSFEEWTVNEDKQAAGGQQRPRVAYVREDYRAPQAGRLSLASGLYAQALPAGYAEVALPGSDEDLPPAVAPAEADPRAMALLRRWQQAQDRLLTYSARVSVSAQAQAKTWDAVPVPEAWRDRTTVYDVSLRRPGRALVTVTPQQARAASASTPAAQSQQGGRRGRGDGGGRRPGGAAAGQAYVAASDGTTVTVYDPAEPARARTVALGDDPAALYGRLRQAGFFDFTDTLTWLLARPSAIYGDAERAVYKGKTTLEDGQAVEVVEVTQIETPGAGGDARDDGGRRRRRPRGGRRGGGAEVTTVTTVYLGADGLPRRVDRFRNTKIAGRIDRDDPPNVTLVARYSDPLVDREIDRAVFTPGLPTRAAAK